MLESIFVFALRRRECSARGSLFGEDIEFNPLRDQKRSSLPGRFTNQVGLGEPDPGGVQRHEDPVHVVALLGGDVDDGHLGQDHDSAAHLKGPEARRRRCEVGGFSWLKAYLESESPALPQSGGARPDRHPPTP